MAKSNFHRMLLRVFSRAKAADSTLRSVMKPPIIVYEKGPLYIFESVEDAESYLEPVDVKNQEYIAYDSEGRLLRLSATSFRVTIESAEQGPNHAEELTRILVGFLSYTGVPEDWLQRASLQELVTKALEYKTK